MKKFRLFLFAMLAVAFSSCYDETNEFAESMFTNEKISNALKSCLKISKDTAVNKLCISDGFYENESYYINLPQGLNQMVDTLTEYGDEDIIDSLVLKMNRTAETVGNKISQQFNSTITAISFSDPNEILNGSSISATSYLKLYKETALISSLKTEIENTMNANGGKAYWEDAISTYYQRTSVPISYDLYRYMSEEIISAIFAEMEKEEDNIRTLPEHRVTTELEEVFGN